MKDPNVAGLQLKDRFIKHVRYIRRQQTKFE